MFVLVSYDIESDKLRAKVAKILEAHGERVQYSVFECHLKPREYARLKSRLEKVVSRAAEEETKSVRFYRLCSSCEGRIELIGQGRVTKGRSILHCMSQFIYCSALPADAQFGSMQQQKNVL